jgi:bacteriocin-like protein
MQRFSIDRVVERLNPPRRHEPHGVQAPRACTCTAASCNGRSRDCDSKKRNIELTEKELEKVTGGKGDGTKPYLKISQQET